MNRNFRPADDGQRFKYKYNGRTGTLEAPPLTDPAGQQAHIGILWLDSPWPVGTTGPLYHWLYVSAADVEKL